MSNWNGKRLSTGQRLQEELTAAQSRLQELQDDLTDLRKTLQDTRSQLRDREAETALVKMGTHSLNSHTRQ